MALYVSIPYILAHRANRPVGALWFNAAETWVDAQSSVTSRGLLGKMLDKVTGSNDNVPHFDAHFMSVSGLVDSFFFVGRTVKEQAQGIIREALRTRYALLPYWYTLSQQHTENGVPPMRHLFYEFENDDSLLEEQKQWMVGNGILARPAVEKDTFNVQVKLPRGEHHKERWYE
ncbi:hypothetical protein CAEBREN_05947 [Caenorhabditis brenneri]|uniref:Uncharacterized protein n=1 Tax=Caenorhabditis brenneri TaxID=135651 RepID=G0N2B5_CAEBE|nr:hypothetical protein CAEBREN_05947 [Caenorhabditis brenneri]